MHHRFLLARILIVFGALASIAMSLPLWQTRTTYPRVPFFSIIPAFPTPFDSVFLLTFAAGLIFLALRPHSKLVVFVWLSAAVFLILQDQSRLQPWFVEYVLLLMAIVFSKNEATAMNTCCLVLAAIYFWTGVHKMNDSFSASLFPWIVSPLTKLGITTRVQTLGILVPYLEMAMGIALVFRRTRRAGIVAVVGMHLFLLAMLGPWALGWNRVVWPWNLTMLALTPCLFWHSNISAKDLLSPGRTWVRRVLFTFLILLPPLGLAGLWDTYPSFALYSGNPLNGSVVLTRAAWERLDIRTRAVAENHSGAAYRIHFEDWSDAAMHVPAYPAERVLWKVAQSFCAIGRDDDDVTYILEKPAGWLYRPGWYEIVKSGELCR